LKISQQRDICSRTWRGLSINDRSIRWQKTCSLCAQQVLIILINQRP